MMEEKRLIDANLVIDRLKNNIILGATEQAFLRNYVNCCPTVDAVEVVHAEWIDIRFDPMWRSMFATCSHCKVRGDVRVKSNECGFAVPDSNHCPNCGAKMDGDGNNG